MHINEAVKKATSENGMIYRRDIFSENRYANTYIKPTDSYDTCIIVTLENGKEIRSCRNWNPTANDLIAEDWEVFKG